MVEIIDSVEGAERTTERGPNASAVDEMIERARRLTPSQARALAGAVAWRWGPVAIAGSGGVGAARAVADSVARAAGRHGALVAVETEARRAAIESPGGESLGSRWSWAENALVAVGAGVIGAIIFAGGGQPVIAVLFGLLAIAGAVVLLLVESRSVTRSRLQAAVGSAAIAIVVRDLIDPQTLESLHGPWATVMRD